MSAHSTDLPLMKQLWEEGKFLSSVHCITGKKTKNKSYHKMCFIINVNCPTGLATTDIKWLPNRDDRD